MKNFLALMGTIFFLSLITTSWAEEIRVSPGSGTLQDAIDDATVGDTLVLEEGGYEGVTTINKSLTIRPLNRATNSVIIDEMNIDGTGIEVVVQGLIFTATIDINNGDKVWILENKLSTGDINTSNYQTSYGDGSLVIVGNILTDGNIAEICTEGAYIAGNILYDGYISTSSYAWIIGNQVLGGSYAVSAEGSVANIIGNRLRCSSITTTNCINSSAAASYILNNVIEVNDAGSYPYQQRGIYVDNGNATIINNVIYGTPSGATREGAAILANTSEARISGNIVTEHYSDSTSPVESYAPISEISNNLCFNNSGTCPEDDGNLNADPQLVDLIEFQLSSTSPAIDAGPADLGLADLDRTRNDMGAFGGPWSIGQYDVQRDPDNYAPYVYPLFKSETMISGGILEIQALGVARLR